MGRAGQDHSNILNKHKGAPGRVLQILNVLQVVPRLFENIGAFLIRNAIQHPQHHTDAGIPGKPLPMPVVKGPIEAVERTVTDSKFQPQTKLANHVLKCKQNGPGAGVEAISGVMPPANNEAGR